MIAKLNLPKIKKLNKIYALVILIRNSKSVSDFSGLKFLNVEYILVRRKREMD